MGDPPCKLLKEKGIHRVNTVKTLNHIFITIYYCDAYLVVNQRSIGITVVANKSKVATEYSFLNYHDPL